MTPDIELSTSGSSWTMPAGHLPTIPPPWGATKSEFDAQFSDYDTNTHKRYFQAWTPEEADIFMKYGCISTQGKQKHLFFTDTMVDAISHSVKTHGMCFPQVATDDSEWYIIAWTWKRDDFDKEVNDGYAVRVACTWDGNGEFPVGVPGWKVHRNFFSLDRKYLYAPHGFAIEMEFAIVKVPSIGEEQWARQALSTRYYYSADTPCFECKMTNGVYIASRRHEHQGYCAKCWQAYCFKKTLGRDEESHCNRLADHDTYFEVLKHKRDAPNEDLAMNPIDSSDGQCKRAKTEGPKESSRIEED